MKRTLGVALLFTGLFAQAAMAQPAPADREAALEKMQQRRQENAERLNLTEEQKPEVEAILAEAAEKRQAVMAKYGVNLESGERPNLGFRTMRKMRGEMNEVNKDTKKSLSNILTDTQMNEFEKIQEEQRAAMRERMKKR